MLVEVARVERDRIVHAQVACPGLKPVSIRFTVTFEHLGVGLADDAVPRSRVDVP